MTSDPKDLSAKDLPDDVPEVEEDIEVSESAPTAMPDWESGAALPDVVGIEVIQELVKRLPNF